MHSGAIGFDATAETTTYWVNNVILI